MNTSGRLAALVVTLTAMGACTTAQDLTLDRSGPELAWGSAQPGGEVIQRLPGDGLQLHGDPQQTFKVMVRATDNVGVDSLRLKVVGTFRCATSAGDWIAPYDVVQEVTVTESRRDPDSRQVYSGTHLKMLGTSCGRFMVPTSGADEELFAVGGSYSLHAVATDTSGKSTESVMKIDTAEPGWTMARL